MNLIISFSGRKDGNSDAIAKYIAKEDDKILFFRDLDVHQCKNCDYECFDGFCRYHDDAIYNLYEEMNNYQKVILIVPMYCGNPASLYFVFHERCQDYFMRNEEKYNNIIKRLFFIGIYGDKEQNPDFIGCFEKWFHHSGYSNHVLGIERHKYNLKLKDSVLDVEELRALISEFVHPTNAKREESAMAVVVCKGQLLTTNEMVFGTQKLSLPKGHVEENETAIEAAIRECYEETNVRLSKANLVKNLTPYSYEFLTPSCQLIRKTLVPYLFELEDFGDPMPKEEQMISVQWMNVEEFLLLCPYENVKDVVSEALR